MIKADSIIAFHEGDSAFTIVKADTVLPYVPQPVLRTGYDRRVHRFRRNWERIIPTPSKNWMYIKESSRVFALTLSWNFSFGRKYESAERRLHNEDNNAGTLKSGK